jgi:glycosyltransferase involved in cell wall biosynthesis
VKRVSLQFHDWLYYKLLPSLLRIAEWFETPYYNYAKKNDLNISSQKDAHLFLTHGRGGGVDKHVEDASAAIEVRGGQAWILRFSPLTRSFILTRAKLHNSERQRFWFPFQYQALMRTLASLGLAKLHIHHTRFFPYCFIRDLPEFTQALAISYDVMLHDFTGICPRVHLINGNFHYCSMPQDANICNKCVSQNGFLTASPRDVEVWRETHRTILEKADACAAPSQDTANRYAQILGTKNISVEQHEKIIVPHNIKVRKADAPYSIGIIGRIHRHKGADVLLACARDAKERKLPLQFVIIGDSVYSEQLQGLGVKVTGVYREPGLTALLEMYRCALVFLPSIWPETYSYVLSRIIQNNYFPVVFDIGAPAERLRQLQTGMILPMEMIESPSLINDTLLKLVHG